MPSSRATPPLGEFVGRRFATHSPFWSWLIFERIGGACAYFLVRSGVSPAVVTLAGGILGIVGAVLLGIATDAGDVLLAGTFLLAAYTLDCADGQVARATGSASPKGAWLDVATDAATVAFVAASLCVALLENGEPPLYGLLLAGAFGAARTVSLFTATLVRMENGGMRLPGVADLLRRAYGAALDTPFVYVLLCATRLHPDGLRIAILAVVVMSVIRTTVSARHHFATGSTAG